MQLASHNYPKLRRLLVEVGMMWPFHAAGIGRVGRAARAKAVEVRVWPVVVRIETMEAAGFVAVTGAPVLAMDV